MQSLNVAKPESLIPALLAAVSGRAHGNLTDDDVTVLLFRPNGFGQQAPFFDRVVAPFRVLGGILGSLRRGAPPAPWPEFSAANLLGLYPRNPNADDRND